MLVEQLQSLQRRMAAPSLWPEMHFSDAPARALAGLLGVDACSVNATSRERTLLEKTQWFDARACDFLHLYPAARVIEIGAGLSTRFHRLSSRIDWPRFSWVDMDSRWAITTKAKFLPQIDNYQLLDVSLLDSDWLAATAADKRPLLIVIEDFCRVIARDRFHKMLADIHANAPGQAVQILWDDSWSWYQNRWRERYWKESAEAAGFAGPEVTALNKGLRCLRMVR